jgi:hypothetical protein
MLLLAGSSCDDFLNEKPQSDFTQEGADSDNMTSAYLNISDAQAGLQGAYNSYHSDIFQQENYMAQDVQSDNCYVGGDGINEEALDMLKITATNAKPALMWSLYQSMAGTATTVIENVKLMTSSSAPEADRNQIIAEAKFIRAWAYFDMVRMWGELPMVLQLIPTITSENLDQWYPVMYPARTSVDAIYDQILSDLSEENIAYLPAKNSGAFQATRGAAYGLLAKIYATRGEKSTRDYSKVVEYCDKVMAQGYQLVGDFDALWQPDNKFTTESIFEVYYTADAPNWAYWTLLKEYDDGSVTWRRYCTPTHELIAKFDKEKDTRYPASIIWKSVPYDTYFPADNYPFAYKIREKNSEIILMRLADVLLLKAEALVELGQQAAAVDIVNQVRTRAGVSSLDRSMSQANARLAVENERQLELFMEGQRWFDLVRNDRMVEVMRNFKDQHGNRIFANVQAFRNLWPVPQGEMDKNTNLTQNEGY